MAASANTHGRNLAAWVAAGVLLITLGLSVAVIPIGLTRGDSIRGLTPFRLQDLQYPLQAVAFAVAGWLVAWRRRENPIWLALSGSGLAGNLFGFGNEYTILALVRVPGSLPGNKSPRG